MKEARLEYDKGKGFRTTQSTDLNTMAAILRAAIGESVELVLKCFVCGRAVECPSCRYSSVCDRLRVSRSCVCEECFQAEEPFTLYTARFAGSYPSAP